MDGYLDQQVPYTLANVRMEQLWCHFAWFSATGLYRSTVSRLHEFLAEAAACARDRKLYFTELKSAANSPWS